MKKRFLSLFLCLLLLVTVLVGCGETEYEKAKEYTDTHSLTPEKEYVTLNMYLPSDGTVDESALKAMQSEFNSVIEPLYRTRIAFHLVDEAAYTDLTWAQANTAKENREAGVVDDTAPVLGDHYPKEGASQFDIFVVTDKAMLDTYVNAGFVTDLTKDLTTSYHRKLNDETRPSTSISTIIYENAVYQVPKTDADGNVLKDQTESRYFGVPANFLIGQYTYYVIDRAFFDNYYGSEKEGVTTAQVLAGLKDKPEYDEMCKVVTGDYRTRFNYDEDAYKVLVDDTSMPSLSYNDLFKGMFCISSLCDYPDRALQVIAELYTNYDLHTTLQYGAKNVTYTLVTTEDGTTFVAPKEGAPAYRIKKAYTGNVLTLYPTIDETFSSDPDYVKYGIDAYYVEYMILQNKDAVYSK